MQDKQLGGLPKINPDELSSMPICKKPKQGFNNQRFDMLIALLQDLKQMPDIKMAEKIFLNVVKKLYEGSL